MALNRLENKAAIVTGAATGIGKLYAQRLAAEGANVAIWDIDLKGAEATAKLVRDAGRKSLGLKADVTSEQECIAAAKATFDAFGRIDILINNAGLVRLGERRPLENIPLEEWNHIINVNLTGTFLASKSVVPYLKRAGRGKIVNVASGTALHGSLARHEYISSKAGVIGFTRAMAVELGEFNINVNAIAPGPVETYKVRGEQAPVRSEDSMARMLSGRYIKRFTYPEDLDGVVAFLASDESDMITGQVIALDGGRVFLG
jgi:NAD(P)-dependent dehydrogenase (short-subunit alcohol dehydrogenase family)